jgi:hypothetical protein
LRAQADSPLIVLQAKSQNNNGESNHEEYNNKPFTSECHADCHGDYAGDCDNNASWS